MYDISVNINMESVTVAIRETGKVSRSKGGSLFAIWENFTLYIAIKNTKNTKVSNSILERKIKICSHYLFSKYFSVSVLYFLPIGMEP